MIVFQCLSPLPQTPNNIQSDIRSSPQPLNDAVNAFSNLLHRIIRGKGKLPDKHSYICVGQTQMYVIIPRAEHRLFTYFRNINQLLSF